MEKGFRLADRVKQIARHHRIDGRMALCRFVCDSVLWALQEVSDHDFLVKGGLLDDQRVRQTDDGDVMYFVPRTTAELYGDFGAAAVLLRQHGFFWHPGEVQPLDMGGKGHGYRPCEAWRHQDRHARRHLLRRPTCRCGPQGIPVHVQGAVVDGLGAAD